MGQVCCSDEDRTKTEEEKKINEILTKRLQEQKQRDEQKTVKLILLGADGAGKSTILQQLKMLNNFDFKKDQDDYKKAIYSHIMTSIHDVCMACRDLGIQYGDDNNRHIGQKFLLPETKTESPITHKMDIKALWNDSGIKTAMTRTSEFHILDSTEYFLETKNLDRICDEKYEPTEQDILRCRNPTKYTYHYDFIKDQILFKVYDVGGQRGKRKRWIQFF